MPPRRKEKTNRRPKGSGSVFEAPKGSGRWYARPPYKAGEPMPEKTPVPDKGAGEALLAKWRRDREDKIKGGGGRTLATWLDYWLAVLPTTGRKKSPRTLKRYRDAVERHIKPFLGEKLLDELEPSDVRLWLSKLQALRTPRNKAGTLLKPLAVETIRGIYARLRQALNLAVIDRRIRFNPCEGVEPPAADDDPAGVALTREQCARLLGAARGHWYEALFFVALATGMREGELRGLRRSNVILDGPKPVLRVREQLQDVDNELQFTPPKSKRSRRDIPLDAATVAVLREHLARVDLQRSDPDAQWPRPDFWNLVFPTSVGTPFGPSNLIRNLRATLRRAGWPAAEAEKLRFHDLRHTAGSLMLAGGAKLSDVSRLLGHSSIAVTDRIYSHSYEDAQREAVAGVTAQLRQIGGA